MKIFKIVFCLFFAIGCGAGNDTARCKNREAMIFQCRAELASDYNFPSEEILDVQRRECERLYQVERCY